MNKRIILLTFLIVTGCAISPTGRSQLMLVSPEQAIDASKKAYIQALQPLAKDGKLDSSPKVSARVQLITGKIIAQAILLYPETVNWHWSIKVIDDPESVNAWCMAGGKMAIHTGLIITIKPTDDELAHVLGHEIAHAIANHTAEKMSVALASQIGLSTVAIVTGGNNGHNATLAGASLAASVAIQLPNNRMAEKEADRIGLELAAKAGYNPLAAVTLWQKMTKVNGNEYPEFLNTHPSPMSRMAALRQLAPAMMPYYEEFKERPIYLFKNETDILNENLEVFP